MTRYAKTMSQALAEMQEAKKITKKERDSLENDNQHGELALKLAQSFGTPQEVKKIKDINKRHMQKGSIDPKDQKERDAISNKYYKMAESLEEGYESEVLKILDDAGIDGYFKNNKLYVSKRDARDAKKALDDSDEITKLPKMVKEGTWKMPDNPKEVAALKKLMSRPLPIGNTEDDKLYKDSANAKLYGLLGDDELFDDLGALEDKGKEKADARPVIIKWFRQRAKDNRYDLGDRTKDLGKQIGLKMEYVPEEVELDEQFDYVLLDKDNKIAGRYSGKNAKKEAESGKKSAHLPPMSIPKAEVSKMKIVPISPKDKKDIGDMVLAIGEEIELDEKKTVPSILMPMSVKKDIEKMVKDRKYKGNTSALMKDVKKKYSKYYDNVDVQGLLQKHAETNESNRIDNFDENYRKLAMKGIGTETKKAAKVGVKTDYYLPKNGDKSFGKITRVTSSGYEITDEKTKKVHKFKFYDPNNDPTSVRGTREEVELDEAKYQVNYSKNNKLYSKTINAKNEDDAEEKAIKKFKIDDDDIRSVVKEGLDEKYDLYHKSFSDAMQHAYDYAKKKLGITVDPKEIDSKVATGPKKPSEGKTNKYRLKGKGGNLQIQVYNKGGSKPFELNMYKEENDMTKSLKDTILEMWTEASNNEGNAFSKALADARKNGDKTFVVSGKTYNCEDFDEAYGGTVGMASYDPTLSKKKKKKDETNKNDKSDDGDGLDAVQPKAVKKKFKDRKDKDIDNDGDVDDSDKFLHKRRKAVSKAIKNETSHERYLETKRGSLRDSILQMWGEKKDLTKEMDNGKNKKTDTGKEVTPVEMSPKMPKVKESKNKV